MTKVDPKTEALAEELVPDLSKTLQEQIDELEEKLAYLKAGVEK